MPYGILKADTLTYYTASGDISIPVSGIAATVSGTIGIPSGTQAAPSISYVGDPDTGFYSPGANKVAIATSGTGRLVVGSEGNVGVGPSTSLGARLDVNTTSTDSCVIRARNDSTSVYLDANNGYAYLNTFSNHPLLFGTNNTERARIDSSGRLLVGTSSAPSVVAGYGSGDIQLVNQASIACIANVSTVNSAFGAQILLAKSRGGTSTVVQNGDIYGQIRWAGADGTDIDSTAASIEAVVDGTPGANDMPGRLVFSTTADGASTPTERMRISSSGVVTIKNGAVAEIGTLTDGATITPDFAANCNFTVTISGNRTMANPTNITAGQAGSVFIVQGSGSNTLGWGSYWDFPSGTAPTLSTASGAVDRVDYIVRTATSIHTVFTANYS